MLLLIFQRSALCNFGSIPAGSAIPAPTTEGLRIYNDSYYNPELYILEGF